VPQSSNGVLCIPTDPPCNGMQRGAPLGLQVPAPHSRPTTPPRVGSPPRGCPKFSEATTYGSHVSRPSIGVLGIPRDPLCTGMRRGAPLGLQEPAPPSPLGPPRAGFTVKRFPKSGDPTSVSNVPEGSNGVLCIPTDPPCNAMQIGAPLGLQVPAPHSPPTTPPRVGSPPRGCPNNSGATTSGSHVSRPSKGVLGIPRDPLCSGMRRGAPLGLQVTAPHSPPTPSPRVGSPRRGCPNNSGATTSGSHVSRPSKGVLGIPRDPLCSGMQRGAPLGLQVTSPHSPPTPPT
jgi:hypothetical protein